MLEFVKIGGGVSLVRHFERTRKYTPTAPEFRKWVSDAVVEWLSWLGWLQRWSGKMQPAWLLL